MCWFAREESCTCKRVARRVRRSSSPGRMRHVAVALSKGVYDKLPEDERENYKLASKVSRRRGRKRRRIPVSQAFPDLIVGSGLWDCRRGAVTKSREAGVQVSAYLGCMTSPNVAKLSKCSCHCACPPSPKLSHLLTFQSNRVTAHSLASWVACCSECQQTSPLEIRQTHSP